MSYINQKLEPLFSSIDEGDEGICRALWLSVILQAILDAKGKFGNTATKINARAWLEGREGLQSEFAAVCTLASIDFKATRRRCKELIKEGSPLVDFRKNKHDMERNRTCANRKRYLRRATKRERTRRQLDLEQVEKVLFSGDLNDNFPDYANDNLPENGNDEFNNLPMENMNEQ